MLTPCSDPPPAPGLFLCGQGQRGRTRSCMDLSWGPGEGAKGAGEWKELPGMDGSLQPRGKGHRPSPWGDTAVGNFSHGGLEGSSDALGS